VRPLISVADLMELLLPDRMGPDRQGTHRRSSGRPPVVLDVRWRLGGPPGIGAYRETHLPGAVFADLDKDLAAPPGSGSGGRHPLPEPGVFEAAMRAAGVHERQHVVVYDDAGATVAARLWWLLRYFGHDRVAVLDGGLAAWKAAGQPVTAEIPLPAPGDFSVGQGGCMPVLDDDDAARAARTGFLLDARAAERYRGEVEPVDPVAGHIPGAISAPATGNVAGDGTLLPPDELRARFAALGLPGLGADVGADPDSTVVPRPVVGAYCGSGVTAAQEVLALELAGQPAALYVGSWSAWSADPARPVVTGREPG
jgi:thiosulfate/3-mercaptopyruvate sulfurtransferase